MVRVTLVLILIPIITFATERKVIGGDIIHSALAEASDDVTAAFLAQQAALKAVITECNIAHRDIKIFKTITRPAGKRRFVGGAEAGISFESCEEGKRKGRERFINPALVKDQELYELHLKNQMGLIQRQPTSIPKTGKTTPKGGNEEVLETDGTHVKSESIMRRLPPRPARELSPRKKEDCLDLYNAYMKRAEEEAEDNKPPGDLEKGEAAKFYKYALSLKAKCRL